MEKKVLIIGAGRIGRGFVAHLFFRSGYRLYFLDASETTVELLNRKKRYRIDLAGEENDITEYVELVKAFSLGDIEELSPILADIEIIVSSVGAGNMERVARFIGEILSKTHRSKALNWIICENANHPARRIRAALIENAEKEFADFVSSKLGLVETQVLRTGMPANAEVQAKEPLALRMQNWWTLPLDKDAFIGTIPAVEGFSPRSNFANELTRKLYTFNGTNGPIAYIGWANGFTILHKAALAYPVFFQEIQEESAHGLIHEFGLNEREQREFMALAMKKYTDPALNDQIERNAVDSKRKLAPDERLVGPATLCLRHGKDPFAYAKAIAAAYAYQGSKDEGTQEIQDSIQRRGIEASVTKYSCIDPSSPLFALIVSSFNARSFVF